MINVNCCNGVGDKLQMLTPNFIDCPDEHVTSDWGGTETSSMKTSVKFI